MARVRFPPRSALPRTITIDKVPGLGDTWYERGVRYWLRRVGSVLLMALVLALVTAALSGFFGAIRESSVRGFYIALSVEIAYSLALMVWIFVQLARHWNDPRAARPKPVSRQAGRAGAVLGTLARTGSFLGALILVVGSLLFLGLYVALLLLMLMPETAWERPVRLRMAEQLRSRGFDIS
jgi:hypothetical protein